MKCYNGISVRLRITSITINTRTISTPLLGMNISSNVVKKYEQWVVLSLALSPLPQSWITTRMEDIGGVGLVCHIKDAMEWSCLLASVILSLASFYLFHCICKTFIIFCKTWIYVSTLSFVYPGWSWIGV